MWFMRSRRPQLPVAHHEELQLPVADLNQTHWKNIRWTDLTERVSRIVEGSGVREGYVVVQTQHTTTMTRRFLELRRPFSRLCINETERGLVRHDMPYSMVLMLKILKFVVVHLEERRWRHDRESRLAALPNEPKNAASHILNFLFGRVSETLIVHGGKVRLGRWQRVIFFDFDPLGREQQGILHRTVEVQVVGVR